MPTLSLSIPGAPAPMAPPDLIWLVSPVNLPGIFTDIASKFTDSLGLIARKLITVFLYSYMLLL